MLAGLARIIEICFIPLPSSSRSVAPPLNDNDSEHTLAPPRPEETRVPNQANAGRAFRHLPPFVSIILPQRLLSDHLSRYLLVTSCFRVCRQDITFEPGS